MATGGRGFHIEVPTQVFAPKVPKNGVQRLPAIYKEMAYEFYVDTLDLRVYLGRRWRVPNVARENGKFKVPITVDEALSMSVEDYAVLVAAPRAAPTPPALNQKLAVLYVKAGQKIEGAAPGFQRIAPQAAITANAADSTLENDG